MLRRQFLSEAAGLIFTGCTLLTGARAQQFPNLKARREVRVGGRRVKTIDIHAHCSIPAAAALMARSGTPRPLQTDPLEMSVARIRQMDAQGIDLQALSINPYWYAAERDVAARIIEIQNEQMAQFCSANRERFAAFASVALQFPDLAVEQLTRAVKTFGMRGVAVGGNVNGEEFATTRFHPFWAKAEELGVLVFIHPSGVPELQKRFQGNGMLGNVIGNPLETTIALSHLIFEGTLDRFPGLKICAAHGGGYLPSYADRSDHGCIAFPQQCNPTPLKKHPTEYLRQMYFDSLVFTPEALRHLVAQCGAGQIMMGTDYPYPWTTTAVDHILATPGLSHADRRAILGETAARLLGIA